MFGLPDDSFDIARELRRLAVRIRLAKSKASRTARLNSFEFLTTALRQSLKQWGEVGPDI